MARRKKPVDENGVPFPQPFAGYEVNARLHEDDDLTLWRAWDQRLDREVLVAELAPDPDLEADPAQDFFNAARAVARIRHPHLVRALDVGRSGGAADADAGRGAPEGGAPSAAGDASGGEASAGGGGADDDDADARGDRFFFVTKHRRARTAADCIASGKPADAETLAAVALGVARALDHLYELGMAHGEIAPEHIHLDEAGTARLWGAGLPVEALHPDAAARHRRRPVYAAPEQFEPDAHPQHRTDLFRFGAVLHHLATGRAPFGEDGAAAVCARIRSAEAVENPRSHAPTLPALLAGLIAQLLEKDPDERPAGAEAVLGRLEGLPAVQALLEAEARAARQRAAADPFAEDGESDPGASAEGEGAQTRESEAVMNEAGGTD